MRSAVLAVALFAATADAFTWVATPRTASKDSSTRMPVVGSAVSRRALLASVVLPSAAFASGGATSGKTTSIPRAKLRYYGRVTTAVAAFEALGRTLDGGDAKEIKQTRSAFFSDKDGSPMEEFKSAGYLLAVAFKIDSKIPPQKIQQCKDHAALLKSMDALNTASGKGVDEAKSAYARARGNMDAYLEGVELPLTGDASYKQ